MAEDFDLDRVINDPAYRRRVIARLNEPHGAIRRLDENKVFEAASRSRLPLADQGAAD